MADGVLDKVIVDVDVAVLGLANELFLALVEITQCGADLWTVCCARFCPAIPVLSIGMLFFVLSGDELRWSLPHEKLNITAS